MINTEKYLWVVNSILNQYFRSFKNKDDLYQAGCLALQRAATNFDISKDTKFSTYAFNYVKWAMWTSISSDKFISGFGNREQRKNKTAKTPISLNTVIFTSSKGTAITLGDNLVDTNNHIENLERSMYVEGLLNKLPLREKEIIKLLYFEEKTQKEIATIFGITQAQVSRLRTKALNLLRVAGGALSA